MRIFTVRRGKFVGEHKIYDSISEASKCGVKEIKTPWYDPKTAVGDWCMSDDGYIAQCLNRSYLKNKRHRSGQYTDLFRFPQGTFYVYYDKKGNPHIKNFYAVSANSHKSSLGNTSKLGRFLTIEKREFIALMKMGFDPYTSYIKAYKRGTAPSTTVTMQVNKLLTDPIVLEELMHAMKPLMERIEEQVKIMSKGEYPDLETLFAIKTAKALLSPNKDPVKEMIILKFAYELLGKPLGLIAADTKATKKEIEEAKYEIIIPPKLGSIIKEKEHGTSESRSMGSDLNPLQYSTHRRIGTISFTTSEGKT